MLAGFDVKNIDVDYENGTGVLCAKESSTRLCELAHKSVANGPVLVETKTVKYVSRTKTQPLQCTLLWLCVMVS